MTKLKFVSHVFFSGFFNKLADCPQSINADEKNRNSTCYTHTKGQMWNTHWQKVEYCHHYWSRTQDVVQRIFSKNGSFLFQDIPYKRPKVSLVQKIRLRKVEVNTDGLQYFVQTQTNPCEVKSGLYVPISQVLRPEGTNSQNSSSKNSAPTECILGIFNILRDMGSVLKDITQNVVRCMESEIEALRSTVVTLFDKVSTEKFYSQGVQENTTFN